MAIYIHIEDGHVESYEIPAGREDEFRLATPEEIDIILNGPAPTLEEARAAKIAEINAGYDAVMAYIQAGYPDKEVLSWERQATQARELTANPDAEGAFVRALAATKGVSVEEMCRRILANAANWEPVAAMLTAQRQLMEEAVWAAETVEEVQGVKVGYTV